MKFIKKLITRTRSSVLIIIALTLMACGPVTVAELPPPAMTDQGLPGICARTPEVQTAIIQALAVQGSGLGCAGVVTGEMHRLRSLSVTTPHLAPGDLHGMPNVTMMEITVEQSWPVPGSLDGLLELEDLSIRLTGPSRDWRVEPGVFREMDQLVKLEVNGRTTVRVHLENGSLEGMENLEELRIDSLESAEPEALRALPRLQKIQLRAGFRQTAERDEAPELPAEIVLEASRLEHSELRNFREE